MDDESRADERTWRGRLQLVLQWVLPPGGQRAPEVSEILEAHRMAWRRIEIRRQEFAPPDLAVAQRIMSGFGRSTKTYYGYERAAHRPVLRARVWSGTADVPAISERRAHTGA